MSETEEKTKSTKPKHPAKFYIFLGLGAVSLISALINILIHFDDTTVFVSKPFIALGVALLVIAFFFVPEKKESTRKFPY